MRILELRKFHFRGKNICTRMKSMLVMRVLNIQEEYEKWQENVKSAARSL
jgi:hypothetical protein